MAAHLDCLADKLIKAGRASNMCLDFDKVSRVTQICYTVLEISGSIDIHSEGHGIESHRML